MAGVYTLPVAFRFEGNVEKAQQLTGQARKYLGLLAESMSFAKLKFLTREFQDAEGNVFRCMINAIGLAPIAQVFIFAQGGGEMDVCTGFIVRAKNKSKLDYTLVNGIVTSDYAVSLSVRLVSEEFDFYNDTCGFYDLGDFTAPHSDWGTTAEAGEPDSDYYIFTFPAHIGGGELIYTQSVRWDNYTDIGLDPLQNPNGFWLISNCAIHQREGSPRVRFFDSDYEIISGKINVLSAQDLNYNACFAVLMSNQDYISTYEIGPKTADLAIAQNNYNLFYTQLNMFDGFGFDLHDGYTITDTITIKSAWTMANETVGDYEVVIANGAQIDSGDFEVDILLFTHRNAIKHSLKIDNLVIGETYNKKIIISVGKPAQFKNGINPHIKIVANKE